MFSGPGVWSTVALTPATPPRFPTGIIFLVLSGLLGACGTSLPQRYVLERSVGDLSFRRYQRVLDVEFPVEGRDAVGHTASYILREPTDAPASSRSADVRFATAFVTVYSEPGGLAAEVRDHLDSLGSYEIEPRDFGGGYVLWLEGRDPGDDWALWVSGSHVLKVGGSVTRGGGELGQEPSEALEQLAGAYQDLYPSDLDEHGHAREGTASFGPSQREREEEGQLDIPRHLREGAPQE